MPQTNWEEKFEEESSHAGLLFIVAVNFWLVFYNESFKAVGTDTLVFETNSL
jgi:hypothetical protein